MSDTTDDQRHSNYQASTASTLVQEVSERSDPVFASSRESLSPVIETLLHTNNAPSADGQIESMRHCLANSMQEVVDLDEEIERTKEHLARLVIKKQEIQDYVEKQKAVLNPIRRLPSEVLTLIFASLSSCVVDHEGRLSAELVFRDSLNIRSMQWVLSHICTQWRTVALTSSPLWSQLHVKIPSGIDGHPMLLGLHVERSRGSPLYVYIVEGFPSEPKRHPITITLLQQAHRWEKLRFHLAVDDAQNSLSRTRPLLPSLHSLVIIHPKPLLQDPTVTNPSWVCDVFQSAPKLRCVALRDICFPQRVLLPWSTITNLRLYVPGASFTVKDLLTMLDGAKMLKRIILRYHFVHGPNDATDSKTIRLTSLNYIGMFPRLETFRDYTHFSSSRSVTLPSLVELWKRSGEPPITFLEFTVSGTDVELLEFLTKLGDTLTTLRLKKSEGDFDETLINALTCQVDGEKHLLPRLGEFLLRGGMDFDATLLVNMIGSRIGMVGNGVDGFRQVTLDCKNRKPPRNLDAFDAFKEEERFKGMEWSLVL
ncbi:hypothetical protein VNI00_008699 [Paramarasmius palmivorus]|uniref:F-box domain-containing protein n=1 Tax=Paramarasmius palmivorus TaxID=297713 RepID=A0AAW0CWH1_9AGAR